MPVASQSAASIVILVYSNYSPLSPCCFLCRWAWSSTEEDLHQMGKLSLRPSDLSHWWLVHRPTRWPHAHPPSGSALRRTAGQYHAEETTALCSSPDPALSMTLTLHHKSGGKRNHALCFFFLLVWLTSPPASTCFALFEILPSCPTHMLWSLLFNNFNLGLLSFSSAPNSQSPLRAACVSTAWKMLIKPCSFSRSKRSI